VNSLFTCEPSIIYRMSVMFVYAEDSYKYLQIIMII